MSSHSDQFFVGILKMYQASHDLIAEPIGIKNDAYDDWGIACNFASTSDIGNVKFIHPN